jgi:microcompartment protein CcmL/EutN
MGDSIYITEYHSISYGVAALDRMVKRAPLLILHAEPICAGKYLIVLGGDAADVKEARDEAEAPGRRLPMSGYLLTGTHPAILEYFRSGAKRSAARAERERPDAIGIFETRTVASGMRSLDRAMKSAHVRLLRLWMGRFIGGKLCYILGGTVSDAAEALKAAEAAVPGKEQIGGELIPSPDAAALSRLFANA